MTDVRDYIARTEVEVIDRPQHVDVVEVERQSVVVLEACEQGPPGPPGPEGAPGTSVVPVGAVDSAADLPVGADPGTAYVVGGTHIWIHSTNDGWVNAGPVGVPGKDGQIRFTGRGEPPVVIVGATPGDTYLDLDTGDIYKLT